MDQKFQTSPKRGRALSLFGQGVFWYGALPNMKDEKALLLMAAFDEVVRAHDVFREILGILGGDDSGRRWESPPRRSPPTKAPPGGVSERTGRNEA